MLSFTLSLKCLGPRAFRNLSQKPGIRAFVETFVAAVVEIGPTFDKGLDKGIGLELSGTGSISDSEGLEIRDALLGQFPCLLDEVILDPADLRGGEGFYPIDAALAKRDLRVSFPAPTG